MNKEEAFGLSKAEQNELLESLGVSKDEVKSLRSEKQRVDKIVELSQPKVVEVVSKPIEISKPKKDIVKNEDPKGVILADSEGKLYVKVIE